VGLDMKVISIIALNTFREIIRDRVLYGLIIFALLLIGVSLALGQLSFQEQARISANFGLTGIHLSSIALAIFVGSTLVIKEIDKKTILTLLARPISRVQFLIGKAFGLAAIIATVIFGLSVVLAFIFYFLEMEINYRFFIAIFGIFLEALVLLGVSLVFSSFTRPILVVSYCVALFLIGHWLDSLKFFAEKSESESFKMFSDIVAKIIPNLETFNWRALPIYGEDILVSEVLSSALYSVSWLGLLLTITALIIRRKDLG
jgi:Cu-processing system permease protein